MAKNLVIVESPAKAKTIGKYLGKQFVVKASLGHVKDLPKKDLSVDVENDFKPVYEVIEGKKKLMQELKQAAKGVENVYLAADPEREGRAFQKKEYWSIDVNLAAKRPPQLTAHLAKKNEENTEIPDQATADAIVKALEGVDYIVRSVTNREKRRNPVPPFITSTLQ